MLGSTYAPTTWKDVEATKVKPNTFGINSSASAGSTTNIDTKISDDSIIRGISLFLINQAFGDTITVSVVDKDGVYFPAGTTVSTPITNYTVRSDEQEQAQYESIAPFKLLGGLYVRIAYTSTGLLTTVDINVNFMFLTVLI